MVKKVGCKNSAVILQLTKKNKIPIDIIPVGILVCDVDKARDQVKKLNEGEGGPSGYNYTAVELVHSPKIKIIEEK